MSTITDPPYSGEDLNVSVLKGDDPYNYILDAKYYCPKLYGHKILKNPGVEDVAKQYLYYMSN